MLNLGVVKPGTTIEIPFDTYAGATGASITLTGLAVTDIEIYKDGSTTQRASDSGYTLLDTDGIDFDGITGIHGFTIDLADNTTAGFYAAGSRYFVVVSAVTVDAQTVNFVAARFTIGLADAVLNTTIATLASQTSFTLTVGPAEDDALNGCVIYLHDVASAVQGGFATVLDYTGSTKTVTLAAGTTFTAAATDNVAVFPPVSVHALQGDPQSLIDLKDFADAGYDPATNKMEGVKLADTLTTYTGNTVQTGDSFARIGVAGAGLTNIDLPNQTMDITGNLSGSVGSVTGAVGSVTGAVGSVTAGVTLAASAVQAIWDALTSALTVVGSIGKLIVDNLNATISSRASQTSVDDVPTNAELATSQAAADDATLAAIAALNNLSAAQVNAEVDTAIGDARLDELLAADSDIDGAAPPTVGSVFHELLTKTAGSFTYDQTTDSLEAVRDNMGTAQTGDNFARLGAPAGASVSADIAAIEAQTDDIGVAGAGLTALGDARIANLDATVSSRASQASVDDLPTNAELATSQAAADDATLAAIAALNNLSAAAAADAVWDEALADHLGAGSTGLALSGATAPSAATVADAVWNEAIAGHLGAGSTGLALNSAGSAGDPWSTAVPGAYVAGTAGKILGDNLNATVSSRASQTSVDDVPTNAELATALGTADDAVLAAVAALNNLSAAGVRAAVGLASANLDTQLADLPTNTELAAALATADDAVLSAIAALNNLSQANVRSAVGLASANLDTQLDALPTNTELTTALAAADDAVLALLALVDAKTTNLPSDPADQSLIIAATNALVAAIAALNNLSAGQVRTELAAELARLDVATSTRAVAGDAMTLTAGERTSVADAYLKRDMSAVTGEAARSTLNALRFSRNKFTIAGGVLTVFKEDDTTVAWTAAITQTAGDPVSASDPA